MKVLKIAIKNILGLESMEIQPGSVTQIMGENGSGKTSCLDAIRAALGSGHDATLLRQGATEGEVVLLLEDGTEIKRRITEEKSDLQVVHPTFGKISKPAAYIKKLADALSLNPVQFLTAPKKDRVDQLLQAIPMQVTADQLSFVPSMALTGVSLDDHALTVIEKIRKAIYDLRTGVNRAEKEKRATARQMSETLPAGLDGGGDWSNELEKALDNERQLNASAKIIVGKIREQYSKDSNEAKAARDKRINELLEERDSEIEKLRLDFERAVEKLRDDTEIAVNICSKDCDETISESKAEHDKKMADAQADYEPKIQAIKERIGHAKAMVEQHAKAESTREFIAQLTKDADGLDAESSKLTNALGRLEVLKASLLEKLPIPGLEVKDGDIFVGGIAFDRVNESKRIRLAIEIAKLRAGSLGLVAVDGLERMDPKTFAAFKKEAAKSNLQFVISRVAEGPLQISTEGQVA